METVKELGLIVEAKPRAYISDSLTQQRKKHQRIKEANEKTTTTTTRTLKICILLEELISSFTLQNRNAELAALQNQKS